MRGEAEENPRAYTTVYSYTCGAQNRPILKEIWTVFGGRALKVVFVRPGGRFFQERDPHQNDRSFLAFRGSSWGFPDKVCRASGEETTRILLSFFLLFFIFLLLLIFWVILEALLDSFKLLRNFKR